MSGIKGPPDAQGHLRNGEIVQSRIWAVVTAVTIGAASMTLASATAAQAAPPEQLNVSVTSALDTPQVGSVTVTYDINQSFRQIASLAVSFEGTPVTPSALVATSNKTSRAANTFADLPPGDYTVDVTVTNRKGNTASGSTTFTVASGSTHGVDLNGARTWCTGASGTFTADDTAVGAYTEGQPAIWSCLNAATAWDAGDPTDPSTYDPAFSQDIYIKYCTTSPPNYSLVLSSWVNYQGDTSLDNFACWEDLTPTPIP